MIEENATIISTLAQVVSAGALVVIAGIAVMMWRAGGLGLSQNQGAGTPSAAQPGTQAPEPITELSSDQWKQVIDQSKNFKGSSNAKVTIVEYTDYQCPFCSRFFTDAYAQIMKTYVDTGKVRYAVQNLPLPFHANANISAQAAECAGDQKKFWEMHDKLFANQNEWANESDPKPKFEAYAREIGINVDGFKRCIADGKFKQKVDDDNALAAKVGASGTPSFFINGKLLVGAQPFSEFEKAINEALK